MRFLKIISAVIIGIALMVGISFIDWEGDTEDTGRMDVTLDNPTATKILNRINAMEGEDKYAPDKYEEIKQFINLNRQENTIDEDNKIKLMENLNIVFSVQLNQKVLETFISNCDENELNELREEVNRLEVEYQNHLEYLEQAIEYFKQYDSINSFIEKTENYLNRKSFNLNTSKNLCFENQEIKNLEISKHCKSKMNALELIPKRLENKHYRYIAQLEPEVDRLVKDTTSTRGDFADIQEKLYSFSEASFYGSRKADRNERIKKIDDKIMGRLRDIFNKRERTERYTTDTIIKTN